MFQYYILLKGTGEMILTGNCLFFLEYLKAKICNHPKFYNHHYESFY